MLYFSMKDSVTSPLDVLKIRFQTQGELTKSSEKIYKGAIFIFFFAE